MTKTASLNLQNLTHTTPKPETLELSGGRPGAGRSPAGRRLAGLRLAPTTELEHGGSERFENALASG